MAEQNSDNIFDFEIGGEIRQIQLINSVHIDEGVESDVYTFVGDDSQVVSIVKVMRGHKSPMEKILSGNKTVEGFIRGKGTLVVHLENGTVNTYYFEQEGYNKEVAIRIGESVQWEAPHDADLVYYKVRSIPAKLQATEAAKPEGRNLKLFLTSSFLTTPQSGELVKLVKKPRNSIQVALFENAAEMEEGSEQWLGEHRRQMMNLGFNVELIDLRKYEGQRVELFEELKHKDVFWFGTGNVFYLHWLLLTTKTNEILDYMIGRGAVYGGDGAGAIVAGPTLKHFHDIHDPNVVPEIGLKALSLTSKVVIPHYDNPKFSEVAQNVNKELKHEGYETVPLKDGQALIIDGPTDRII